MKVLEKSSIATADEVLRVFTQILRQELTEEVTELNQITGEFVTIEKQPCYKSRKRIDETLPNKPRTQKDQP